MQALRQREIYKGDDSEKPFEHGLVDDTFETASLRAGSTYSFKNEIETQQKQGF